MPHHRPTFFLLLTTFLFSCRKYQDGPWMSVRSKTERVCNKWKISAGYKLYFGLTEIESLEFKKNGEYIMEIADAGSHSPFISGSWTFHKEKEEIVRYLPAFTYRHFNLPENYDTIQILRLKEKEFWFGSNLGEIRLSPYL